MEPKSSASIRRRLSDLSSYQLPRLRECRGPIIVHAELADELRLDLESVRKGLEVVQEEIEAGASDGQDRQTARAEYEDLYKEYKRLRHEYRSAVLSSKRQITSSSTIPAASRSQSQPNFGLKSNPAQTPDSGPSTTYPPRAAETLQQRDRDRGRDGDDAVQTKTNEVTDALRRTLGTMQVELERSVLSVQMLDESTRTLRTTSNLYDTYSTVLHTSAQLVKALERADWYDRLVIALAFLLFLLTVGWVIKRRVLDKVVGGVGWWVGGSWRLVRMGVGLGGGRAGTAAGKVGTGAGQKAVRIKVAEEVVGKASQALSVAVGASAAAASAASTLATVLVSASGGAPTSIPPSTEISSRDHTSAASISSGSQIGTPGISSGRHDEL